MLWELGIVFIAISVALYLMIDDPVYRNDEPAPNSYAAEYVKISDSYNNGSYQDWIRYANEFLDRWNSGSKIESYRIEMMLEYGFRVCYSDRVDDQLRQQAQLEVNALLEGVLGLGEEELALFHKADEQSVYSVRPDPAAREQLVSLIEAKLADREDAVFWNDIN